MYSRVQDIQECLTVDGDTWEKNNTKDLYRYFSMLIKQYIFWHVIWAYLCCFHIHIINTSTTTPSLLKNLTSEILHWMTPNWTQRIRHEIYPPPTHTHTQLIGGNHRAMCALRDLATSNWELPVEHNAAREFSDNWYKALSVNVIDVQ